MCVVNLTAIHSKMTSASWRHQWESQGISKVSRIHPLDTMNVCKLLYCNMSNSWDSVNICQQMFYNVSLFCTALSNNQLESSPQTQTTAQVVLMIGNLSYELIMLDPHITTLSTSARKGPCNTSLWKRHINWNISLFVVPLKVWSIESAPLRSPLRINTCQIHKKA